MIKTIFLGLFFLLLLYLPFLAVSQIRTYDKYSDEFANRIECYPVETCRADFNRDGKNDVFTVVEEPNEMWLKNYYRLKIFAEQDGRPKEILNLRYSSFDTDYRTHLAVVGFSDEEKHLVIFDTVNAQQVFAWDGTRLSPTTEQTIHENFVRNAMARRDEGGGAFEKEFIDSAFFYLFALYYFVLSIAVGLYFYAREIKIRLV
jgi:hypothetical protein